MARSNKPPFTRRPEDWFSQVRSSEAITSDVDAVLATRFINTTAPITGGGSLAADRTLVLNGTKAQFNSSCSDGDFLFVGDISQYTDEMARDAIGAALVAGSNITITVNDAGDTITIAASGSGYSDEQAQDAIGTILVDSSTVDFTYTDVTPEITASVKPASIGATHLIDTWVLIETLNPSAVASINSEAWVSGGYKVLKFIASNISMSADDTLMAIRFKLNGTYKSAANYSRITKVINTAGTAADALSGAGTSILLTSGTATHLIGNAAAEGFSCEVVVFDPDNATQNKRCQYMSTYYNPSGVLYTASGSGGWTGADATAALQGVQFLTAGGNFSGTVKVLGLK